MTQDHGTAEELLESLQQSRKERWIEIVENMDLTYSSRHALQTIKKLDPDSRPPKNAPLISPCDIAKDIKERGKYTPNQSYEKQIRKEFFKLVSSRFAFQWPVPHNWYLLYRAVVAVVLVIWVAGDIVYETRNFYSGSTWLWLIFATNWSFLALAITAVVLAITCWLYRHKPYWIIDPIHIRSMPYSLKLQWMLYNISSCSALVVTTGYWGYVAFVSDSLLLTSHMSRLKHTANTLYVIADLFISATPIRLQHMFLTIFMASLYIVFNALYYLSLGTVVIDNRGHTMGSRRGYYFMNWVDPVEAICTSVLGMLMAVVAQFILHLLYLLRRWIHRKYAPQSNMAGQDSEMQNIISRSSTYNSMNEP
ncbi:protein rolling stone [Elysia marginata]|uniref:Protein rolling stone n=1 Tax=Elysia marginata TaxID=1093978 RepID=A0AAV4JT33_9GAST|nr:protein rolling stone [Elysia marginata]